MTQFSPLPYRLRTSLKYAQAATLTGTSGIVARQVWNASSVYDPDYTGTGHQPRGFDQLMPLYDHFVVRGSRIRVEVTPTSTSGLCVAGVATSAVVTPETSWIDYAEYAQNKSCMFPVIFAATGVFPKPVVMEMDYSPEKNLGIPDPLTADKLQGTISANPSDNAFFHVWCQDINQSSTVSVWVKAEIIYDVEFIEPVQPAQS